MRLLLTGNPGTEDVISEEAREKLSAKPLEVRSMHGRVVVETHVNDVELLEEKVLELRTIHYAGILLYWNKTTSPTLEWIEEASKEAFTGQYAVPFASFAVKTVREGNHSFTSMDISRIVGNAVYEAMQKAGGSPIVRLNSPSILIRTDLIENQLYISLSLTGDYSRHIRMYRVYDHPAALKPTLAAVMLRLAGAQDGDTVLDPMCGSGTVAIEAAHIYESSKIICNDINPQHIRSAISNSYIARVRNRITFYNMDATDLPGILSGKVDVIVSNPPYGIRLGSKTAVKKLYKRFAQAIPEILSRGGRVSLITPEGSYMKRLLAGNGLEIKDYRKVKHGDLWASIITGVKPK
jgi:tRNA (guanine6-N2)-methyltransferase